MFAGTRGLGLLSGIEFRAPKRFGLRMSFEAFRAIHPAMFGQMLVMRMFRNEKILTQMCGNSFMVLKTAPPLVASEEQIQVFVDAAEREVAEMHNSGAFWSESLALARRAVNVG
jgi:ornithine--oxo-acid transaminase